MKNQYLRIFTPCLVLTIALVAVFLPVGRIAFAQETGSNWQGNYWNNQTFSGNPTIVRTDPSIVFNWAGGSPDPAIPADHFSVRWYNTITFAAGTYRFSGGADDGIRVALDGNLIINRFTDAGSFTTTTADETLTAGPHQIIVDYFEDTGNAGVLFTWTNLAGGSSTSTPGAAVGPQDVSTIPTSKIWAFIRVQAANVRTLPDASSNTLAQVFFGSQYHVVANNGANTWFVVEIAPGQRGWLYRRTMYLYNGDWTKLPVTQQAINPPAGAANVQGEARISALVRNAPSLTADKLGVINQGDDFQVLKLSLNRAWILVNAHGLQGWIFLPNVKVIFGDLGLIPYGN
jgi:PA14 domain